MRPIVRALEERDHDAVIALSLRAWAPVFASLHRILGESGIFATMYPDWRADQARAVQAALHAEEMHVWVAEWDTTVAGFLAARLDPESSMGEIYMIAVDPAHQRHGIASALISLALTWFQHNGMALAMVETGGDPAHAPARHTYDNAGFVHLPVARYFKKL